MGPPGPSCLARRCVTRCSHEGEPRTVSHSHSAPALGLQCHPCDPLRVGPLSTKSLSEDVPGGLFMDGVKWQQPMCARGRVDTSHCVFS